MRANLRHMAEPHGSAQALVWIQGETVHKVYLPWETQI